MHARAVVLKYGFRHDRHRFTVPSGHIFDDVFVDQNLVSHARERRKPHINFCLPRCANLMMVNLYPNSAFLQRAHHLRSKILLMVHGRDWKIALLVARLVTEIWWVP